MKTVCETIGVARSNVAERAAGRPQKRSAARRCRKMGCLPISKR
jgi:hypothetical protein